MSVPPKRPTKPQSTINRTFAQRPKTAMQAQTQAVDKNRQNLARSTGRAQPMSMARTEAQANAMRNAGNTQKPRVPKQAVQIKPSASKIKGPTNAPLKSRRASAQNRMAQRKASMMARRSK